MSMCARVVVKGILIASLCGIVIPLAIGQETKVEPDQAAEVEEFRQSALRSIRRASGAVFLINARWDTTVKPWIYDKEDPQNTTDAHFWVEEVIKPFRSRSGTYFIPFAVFEQGPYSKRSLMAGKCYLVSTQLRLGLYGYHYLDAAIQVPFAGWEGLVDQLKRDSDRSAVYGASDLLLKPYLQFDIDSYGVQTPHVDGFLEPDVFGLTIDVLRSALKEGRYIGIAECTGFERPPTQLIAIRFRLTLLEHLGGGRIDEARLQLRPGFTLEDLVALQRKQPEHYGMPNMVSHRLYIIICAPEGVDGKLPLLVHFMPIVSRDDRTVKAVKDSLEKIRGDEK